MADPANPSSGAPPSPGQSPSGQSPPGSSPATTPVPNRGVEAQALAQLNVIVNALLNLAPKLGAGSDVGRDVLKAVTTLSKYVPPGSTSQGVQNNQMMEMMRTQQQQQPMAALMAARGGQGAPPQPSAPPPTGAQA